MNNQPLNTEGWFRKPFLWTSSKLLKAGLSVWITFWCVADITVLPTPFFLFLFYFPSILKIHICVRRHGYPPSLSQIQKWTQCWNVCRLLQNSCSRTHFWTFFFNVFFSLSVDLTVQLTYKSKKYNLCFITWVDTDFHSRRKCLQCLSQYTCIKYAAYAPLWSYVCIGVLFIT